MNKKIKLIAGMLAFVLAFVLVLAAAYVLYQKFGSEYKPDTIITQSSTAQNITEASTQSSSAAADFTVTDADGNPVKLSDYIGKSVVLNFWASWCPPCKSEMPDFEEAYKKYGTDVQFMMINMTDGKRETVDVAKAYVAGKEFSFPVFFDTEGSAAVAYSAYSIPATYFIDKSGNVVSHAIGMIDAEQLEAGLQLIIE